MNTLGLAAAIAIGLTGTAQASTFVGDTANFDLTYGAGSVYNEDLLVIDPGTEATVAGAASATINADVGVSTLTVYYDMTSLAFIGAETTWTISGLDTDDGSLISGLTLTSGNAALLSGYSFTEDSVTVDVLDYDLATNGSANTWVFDIETTLTAVPLPAGLPLLLAGLGALGLTNRARRRA